MARSECLKAVRFGRSAYWIPLLLGGVLLIGPISDGWGSADQRTVPGASYHGAFGFFYEGDYKDALDLFTEEWRHGIKTTESRWIDSICYHTMIGECHYQMGNLGKALDHYTEALNLYLAFPDWMLRVQFPPGGLRASGSANFRPIPWGPSARRTLPAHVPTPMLIGQGRLDNNAPFREGGRVQMPILYPVDVQEIVRCTALAIRRRTELLGPVGRHDAITARLIATLSQPVCPPNHWSQAWVDVQHGLALLAGGKDSEAVSYLNRSLVAAGQFDHNLTATALLELGRLELGRGNYPKAVQWFQEASISAVYFDDLGVLEESFRYASLAYILANQKGVYPPLVSASRWAKVSYRQLRVSLALCAAEHQAIAGQTRAAAGLLDDAQLLIARRSMGAGRIGARMSFLRGLVLFQQGKVAAGDQAVTAAMNYQQHGSLWLFHIGLVDGRLPTLTSRAAMTLYQEVLRDPQPIDWSIDPMESLAVLVTPHPGPLERWFLLALQRQSHDPDMAMDVAERIRRHRFFSSLTFGGRLQALRWILEAPSEALNQRALLQRQDLLANHADYEQLLQEAAKVRAQLKQMPLVNRDQKPFQEQSRLLGQLATISGQQEVLLRQMAVRREPADLVFPPLRSLKEIQKGLPAGQAMLGFLAAGGELHAFLLNHERYRYWTVKETAALPRRIAALLREMGQVEQNRELTVKELSEVAWRQSARQLLTGLLDGSGADFSKKFPELVIVPDGVLWYLPFEALQVSVGYQPYSLISRFRIRYAPTASLAIPDERGRSPTATTAVVLGKLYPRDDESVAQTAFAALAKSVPGSIALGKAPLPGPASVYSALMDRLIVLDDIAPPEQDAYSWLPIQIDRGKAGNTLSDWMGLPWGGPEVVILPGYHTAAEGAMKRAGRAPGAEVFLSVCGLMSCGARTILISRWRTGGQTSFDLVREFAQELPHATPSDAWQRAVLLVTDTSLNLEAEPRVKRSATDVPPKASHPFFWAGYMLVDSGTTPRKEEPAAAEKPAADAKKAGPKKPAPPAKDEAAPADDSEGDKSPDAEKRPRKAASKPKQAPADEK